MNFVISVVNRGAHDTVAEICNELMLPMTLTLNGKGTAVKSMRELLGIEVTQKSTVITIADSEKTKQLISAVKRKLHIGVPGHGIVIAVPLKSVGGGKTLAYLNPGEEATKKEIPNINYAYELIVAITNEGCTDMVMNAARAAGARGGTVIHAKGTGNQELRKFYNVSIAEEKEVVLIVSSAAEKSNIMHSIIEKAGPDSQAGTIVFSLPTTEVAGFGFFEE